MDIKDNQTAAEDVKQVNAAAHPKWMAGSYIFFAVLCLGVYFLLRFYGTHLSAMAAKTLPKVALASCCVLTVLALASIAERAIKKHAHAKSQGYNLVRVIRLLTLFVAFLIFITFLNANWYAAAASLGIVSLIMGFALQTPIVSLIGWVYIVIRSPFKVGDRIQVGSFTGDVVEISYLDTTLWEFAGDYLSNDLPSGRLIRFPNSLIFQDEVYNYSWNKFPYIWNEIPFHVAYESDLAFIEAAVRKIATEELGDMNERVKELREMIKNTAVDEVEVREYPFVQFRINANTWVEVLLIYLVEPKHSGATRSKLIKRILAELMQEPEKVMFPKTNAR